VDNQRQDVESIMRRAEAHGHDPHRVARALNHRSEPPPERQRVTRFEPRPRMLAGLLGRVARRARTRTD
jgi:hypothetical protein